MTKKDFELIAKRIKSLELPPENMPTVRVVLRSDIARQFAMVLKATNPTFDVLRFLKACGNDTTEW